MTEAHTKRTAALLRINAMLIADELNRQYADLLKEPLPPHLAAMLEKLDQKEPTAGTQKRPSALDRATLAHLGQELRAFYRVVADKPAYLGDRAFPPEVENKLVRMEAAMEVHEKGLDAVREALHLPSKEEER
jgi:hypothetical protein